MIIDKPKKINLQRYGGSWVIFLSFIFAFMLAIMPLPVWATAWRPDWVAIILLYWCITIPRRVGMATAGLAGIVLDVLKNTLLGQNMLGLCLIAFFSLKIHLRMRLFPPWQQAMIVFWFITLINLIDVWIQSLLGYSTLEINFIYPAITSFFLWPWLSIILREIQSTYKIE